MKLFKQKSSAEKPQVSNDNIPTKGLVIWLDATKTDTIQSKDGTSIEQWKPRKANNQYILTNQTRLYRLNNKTKPSKPYFESKKSNVSNDFFPMLYKGIQCDYLHTFKLEPQLTNIQTIISFHSFNQRLNHTDIFTTKQDRGTWCNFYLFCSSDFSHYPFHTNGNVNNQHKRNLLNSSSGLFVSGHSHKGFKQGNISLDNSKFSKISNSSHWLHNGIAIVECSQLMSNLRIDQIGAERQCHHFSGVIYEIIVYDRILNDNEKLNVVEYLFEKYYGDYAKVIIKGLRNEKYQMIDGIINLFLSFVFPGGLVQFAQQFMTNNAS